MKRGRRKERPALPPAPLTFAYPLGVPGSAVPGAQVLAELPGEHAGHVFMALRAVLAWAHGPGSAGELLRERRAEPWLDVLVRDAHALVLRDPDPERMPLLPSLAVLLADMSAPERADAGEVSRHCLNLSEWALTQDATGTVLAFAEAAALASPWSGRLAWVVGKLYRSYGRMRDAEYWLKRASRLAVWTKDWEAQARCLNSLGNLYHHRGNFGQARHAHAAALRIVRRKGLRQIEAEVLHDLFVVSAETGQRQAAEEYATKAYAAYGFAHPNLPKLVHDVAQYWIELGYFARVLPVMKVLLQHLHEPDDRLRVLAAGARASGACGEAESFLEFYSGAWAISKDVEKPAVVAAALTEIGLGASSLSFWPEAIQVLEVAVHTARDQQQSDVLARAEAALELVRRHQVAESCACRGSSSGLAPADVLAIGFLQSLERRVAWGSSRTDRRDI